VVSLKISGKLNESESADADSIYSNAIPKLLIGLDHGHLGLPLRTRRFARD